VKHLTLIVARIGEMSPYAELVIREDSGSWREELMRWCEARGVGYAVGLAKNRRLLGELGKELSEAKCPFERTGQAARVFTEFSYRPTRTGHGSGA